MLTSEHLPMWANEFWGTVLQTLAEHPSTRGLGWKAPSGVCGGRAGGTRGHEGDSGDQPPRPLTLRSPGSAHAPGAGRGTASCCHDAQHRRPHSPKHRTGGMRSQGDTGSRGGHEWGGTGSWRDCAGRRCEAGPSRKAGTALWGAPRLRTPTLSRTGHSTAPRRPIAPLPRAPRG